MRQIGPIDKAAIEGQKDFGNALVQAIKTAVSSRAAGVSKGAKAKGRRKKRSASASQSAAAAAAASATLDAKKGDSQSWGMFEALRGPLGPVVGIFKPLWSANVAIGIIAFLLFTIYTKGLSGPAAVPSDIGLSLKLTNPQRLAAYEEMWRAEENELWKWLEDRTGMDGISFPTRDYQNHESDTRARRRAQKRHGQSVASKINEEQISQREMNYAIQVVRERLNKLEEVVGNSNGPDHSSES